MTLAAGAATSVLTAAIAMLTTPILLRWLGTERFGVFRVAIDWFGYVGLLEFGVGGALQALLAQAFGRDDRAGVAAVVKAGTKAYLLTGGLMAAAAAGLVFALPALVRAPPDLAGELRAGCWVYLLVYAWLPLAAFRPLAEAGQRGYVVNLFLAAQVVVVAAASVALAAAGWGLVGQFLALVLGGSVFAVGLAWAGVRRFPEILLPGTPDDRIGRSVWRLSWPNLLWNLSGRVGLLSDNILLVGFLGPAAATPFILTQRLITMASVQVQAVGGATWAGLVELHHRGDKEGFVRGLIQVTRLTSTLGAGLLLPIAVWNRDLIGLWVGPDQYAGPAVTWLAAGNAWGLAVLGLWAWPLTGTGQTRAVLPIIALGAAVNLIVSTAATAAFGQPGPLVGTALSFALVNWWGLLLTLRRQFGIPPRSLVRAAAGPALVAAPYGSLLVLFASNVPAYDPGWPRWACWLALAAWLAAAAGGYLILAWFLVLSTDDRRVLTGRIWRRGAA